jgi:hypothetical protein
MTEHHVFPPTVNCVTRARVDCGRAYALVVVEGTIAALGRDEAQLERCTVTVQP